MLVSNLISSSLRKIGALSSGETIETARQGEALSALQSMLRSWGAVSVNVFANIKESFSLISGKSSYSWGSGGDISTVRPNFVTGAYVEDGSGISHPVDIIPENFYDNIASKDTTSRPYCLYFQPLYPLAYIYLYPVPVVVETLHLTSLKPFTEIGSFALATDTLSFPSYYEEPIIYNLAVRLAPEYGRTVSAEVAAIANDSYNDMVILNSSNKVEQVYVVLPAQSPFGVRYSINSDTFR
jgi:hypothetical protein